MRPTNHPRDVPVPKQVASSGEICGDAVSKNNQHYINACCILLHPFALGKSFLTCGLPVVKVEIFRPFIIYPFYHHCHTYQSFFTTLAMDYDKKLKLHLE